MDRNASKGIASWQAQTSSKQTMFPPGVHHQFKGEELTPREELSKVSSRIVLSLYLARIGRPRILWSVDKLARAVPKWNKACDKRLAGLLSHTHFTSNYRRYCHVGNTASECRVRFQRFGFCRRSWKFQIDLRRNVVHFRTSRKLC